MQPRRWIGWGLATACALAIACSDGAGGSAPNGQAPTGESAEADAPGRQASIARGERIYQNLCIACHNGDPTQDGAVGPAVAGASHELLEARVIRGTYPEGYTPKRPGGAMPQFPYLKDSIGDLAAYLDQTGP